MIKINSIFDKIFPNNHSIVFLHAHPDDESFLSAGLLNELAIRKKKFVTVFCAASIINNKKETIVRQKEANRVCRVLGAKSILYLKFCDYKYSKENILALGNQKISEVCKVLIENLFDNKINPPFILISYDKNGGYGHMDHKAVHKIGRYFQKKYKNITPFLYELTINRHLIYEWLSDAGNNSDLKLIPKLSYWSSEFGLPAKEIAYYYNLTEKQLKLKRKVLSAYKLQINPNEFPLSLSLNNFRKLFGKEFLSPVNLIFSKYLKTKF